MTGEPVHTASKETMTSEIMQFLSELAFQLSITDLKVKWPLHCNVQPVNNEKQ